MTASERYVVELDFEKHGDFGMGSLTGHIGKAQSAVDKFKNGWSGLASSVAPLGNAIDSVVGKVVNLGVAGAAIAGGALFAGAVYGVAHLNSELEMATISMGTIFNANGMAASVPSGMLKAKDVIGEMRIDAQKLPGEFSELLEIFNNAAIPAFHSGASIEELRKLSGEAMAFGKVAMMENPTVARELNMLLEGRAGSHNRLGAHLGLTGDKAKAFNAESGDKRLAELTTAFHKYSGSIDEFGNSFDAQSSTLIDNFKIWGTTATAPLYEAVKGTMADVNQWFMDNKQIVNEYATTFGYKLRDAFLGAVDVAKEYGPILVNFAEVAVHRFQNFWDSAASFAESIGVTSDSLKSALQDPNGTIDKLVHLGEIWLALKGAGMLFGAGQAALGAASGIGGMMQGAGMIGGAAAGAEGGAAALGGAALAGAGAAAAAALGALALVGWQVVGLENDREEEHTKNMRAKAEASMREIDAMVKRGDSEELVQQRTNEMHEKFMAMGENMAAEMLDVSVAAAQAAGTLSQLGTGAFFSKSHEDFLASTEPDWMHSPLKTGSQAAVEEKDRNPSADAHKHKGGGGGTIQKVEIVVTSNQNPSRIARAIVGHIGKLARNPGVSPDVRNFSDLESG